MGIQSALFFIIIFAVMAIVIWGAVSRQRLIAVAAVSVFLMMLSSLGCWYAFIESQSLAWGIGYGLFALFSLGVSAKHLMPTQQQV